MKVNPVPSAVRFIANSDFDEKLVVMTLGSTFTVPTLMPDVVNSWRKIGEVTPKLASGVSLLKTPGYEPLLTALPPPGSFVIRNQVRVICCTCISATRND